jgi:hypothetical protein
MAEFIVLDPAKTALISRFDYAKKHNIEDKKLAGHVEEGLGELPVYGSLAALMENVPELANLKNRFYEVFSRRKQNTLYVPEANLLIIKCSKLISSVRGSKAKENGETVG